ncbi:MAG: GNAT family N-acetyltransferase [Myxococcales bacterium]|nr:GNAT family N-acetyltransferase [Myxococcales bacterium]
MQRLQQRWLASPTWVWFVGLGAGWLLFSLSSVLSCAHVSVGACVVGHLLFALSFVGVGRGVWRFFDEGERKLLPKTTRKTKATSRFSCCPLKRDVYAQLRAEGIQVASRIQEVPRQAWDALVPLRKMPLRSEFLSALEQAPPDYLVGWRYAWWEEEGEIQAVASFQLLEIPLASMKAQVPSWLQGAAGMVMGVAPRRGDGAPSLRVLLCGNALMSGDFGFHANESWGSERLIREVTRVQDAMAREFAREGRPVVWSGIKDLPKQATRSSATLEKAGLFEGSAEPVMSLHFAPAWQSFDHYQDAMVSKYRQRLRAARKKGAALKRTLLDLPTLREREQDIQALFEQVLERADFCMVRPHAAMLSRLKAELGDDLMVQLYEVDGRAVGFLAAYRCGEILEANWVGMDYEANGPHCLYQNLLYDFVELAFERGCRGVDFGRTATEIKSCIGAEPEEMSFLLRGKGRLRQHLLQMALPSEPPKEWVLRHPFHQEPSA